MADDFDYRVRLSNSTNLSEKVTFEVTPDLIETRNVNYKTIDPIHAPGQIMAYQNTPSRSFNISQIRLISRTPDEARKNLKTLHLLKGWTMPVFGASTTLTEQEQQIREQNEGFSDEDLNATNQGSIMGSEMKGAPPAVLLLSAYSRDSKIGSMQHISRVPVVIQNLSIPYPSDCDYIPATGLRTPMPTIMTIDMTLMETHAPVEYERFSLAAYKSGTLGGF